MLPSGFSRVLLARMLAMSMSHASCGSMTSNSSNSLCVFVFFSVSLVGDVRDPSVSRDARRARSWARSSSSESSANLDRLRFSATFIVHMGCGREREVTIRGSHPLRSTTGAESISFTEENSRMTLSMRMDGTVHGGREGAQVCQDGSCGVVITTGSLLVSSVKDTEASPQP